MDINDLNDKIETLSEAVHDSWMSEKKKQGFHAPSACPGAPGIGCDKCHADMIPYLELAENIKDYDRVTVRTVLDAIKTLEK